MMVGPICGCISGLEKYVIDTRSLLKGFFRQLCSLRWHAPAKILLTRPEENGKTILIFICFKDIGCA